MARHISDTARANVSSLVSALVGAAVVAVVAAPASRADWIAALTLFYLVAWPVFALTYLIWTHLYYARRGPRALAASTRRERNRRWWSVLFGYGGASSWTLTAASASVIVTLLVAQNPAYRASWVHVVLGLACVAASWALMVYAFALEFLRLGDAGEHFSMPGGDMRFDDHLTLAVMLSALAGTGPAEIRTREAWRLVRTNTLFAFVFNSVIVAMVVSMLLGGLLG